MYGITPRGGSAAVLLLSVAAGAALRLTGLERRGVTHPEMYVPGIHLGEGISEPAERTALRRIVTGTFSSDTHPPGYYLLMFPWTRVAGTSLTAMRLPSALLGTACIPLVYALGTLTAGEAAGAVAAALLAVNGYHVFWSQVARMFALECFLGLAASVLLLRIGRGAPRRPVLIAAYAVLMLAGVASHVFFWTLLLTHMVWTFANAWGRGPLPDICRAQLAAAVLGCPLVAFAAYQSGTTVAELSSGAPRYFWEYLSFAFALPTGESGFFAAGAPFTGTVLWRCARSGLFLVALVLAASGIRRLLEQADGATPMKGGASGRRLWEFLWIGAAAAGTLEILFFVRMTGWLPADQIHPTLALTRRLTALPGALALAALLADRFWARLPYPGRWLRALRGVRALTILLAILPFVLLGVVSQIRPLLNQRGLLLLSPYLLLLLATGLLAQATRMRRAALAIIVTVACAASLYAYREMTVGPFDYARFASALKTQIKPGDLVFIRKIWSTTPILYYLSPDRYRMVGHDYAQACRENPRADVWVVLLRDPAPGEAIRQALLGYRPIRAITVPEASATLYEPARDTSPVPNL